MIAGQRYVCRSSRIVIIGGADGPGAGVVRSLRQRGFRNLTVLGPVADAVDQPRDGGALRRALVGADFVIHAACAAVSSPRRSLGAIEHGSARRVLEEALRARVQRVVWLSSQEVYGVPTPGPVGEDEPLNAVSAGGQAAIEAYADLAKSAEQRLDYSRYWIDLRQTTAIRDAASAGQGRIQNPQFDCWRSFRGSHSKCPESY